jgi:hypothetical protein
MTAVELQAYAAGWEQEVNDQDQLLTLAAFQSLARILTSNYDSKKKAPAFGVVLASAPYLQLRMVERKLLHDRIVLPTEGRR